jgi:hypothetical protein
LPETLAEKVEQGFAQRDSKNHSGSGFENSPRSSVSSEAERRDANRDR